ncbi:MAG: class I SAM-dependent methyltransferase [Thermoflexibacteraceae bacterium]|jgi:2-polyprenyl-3-methyl-5-hydroxy-6-metoxy-1,4-benzoquinol methylase
MEYTVDIQKQLERETTFHNDWADAENIENIDVLAQFEGIAAIENKFIVAQMGNLKGKKILDVGAGFGESSVYFALQGAEVVFNDISPKMMEVAQKLAQRYGVTLDYVVAPVEELKFAENTFDFIYCANVMHHVPQTDHFTWLSMMHKCLKKGGTLFTFDPLKYNPAINVYRKMATDVRTIDETPLGFDVLDNYNKLFTTVQHKEFWLSTLLLFINYYFIQRVHPNEERYWKKMYKENDKTIGWWFKPLIALDSFLLSLPLINRLAWNTVIYSKK